MATCYFQTLQLRFWFLPLVYGRQMHLHFATAASHNCLCIPLRQKPSLHRSMSMDILSCFCSFSWHRKGFRPRCLWKSNWGIYLWHQQEQQFGHGGRQDAEGWDLFSCTYCVCILHINTVRSHWSSWSYITLMYGAVCATYDLWVWINNMEKIN